MVLSNHRGHCLRSKIMRFPGHVSVLVAEIIGVLEALQWTQELPAHEVIVESDSLQSVNAINRK